ncbi:GPP34 family phosphoprotein [Actinacidiphila epipremni]|uniref:GPP34 family phosphoprotein n=1 Tax=Actinacidiphila epipremni TaxID=2053013 RepID=A0ABX0ZPT5_9ACTN|nr:GPP34 family phosphoprotein [Actinacidiphila epipremni]NJP43636.1 GPP34 family phosphoprotein [Actinacidiphila epipremni]
MTTARDLLFVAMDMPSVRPVERGDLSLALAGAELIDLLGLGAAALDGEHVLPGGVPYGGDDPLLGQAAKALRGAGGGSDSPDAQAAGAAGAAGETVEDWLWRRGRGLPEVYLDALEVAGLLSRERRRRFLLLSSSRVVLAESAGRRRAAHRWAADEPTLLALAAAIGISGPPPVPEPPPGPPAAVVTALDHALAELAQERTRRSRRLDEATQTYVRRGY